MKKISFALTLIGLFILLILSTSPSSLKINSNQNISGLLNNQKVSLTGIVTSESTGNSKTLIIDNKITVLCDCKKKSFLNKNITILGIVDDFNGKKIIALKIKEN